MLRLSVVLLALLCGSPSSALAQSSVPGSVIYRYDALGRLIEARYPNGRVIAYSYDKAGNRTTVTVGG